MNAAEASFLLFLALVGLQRAFELVWSRRNERRLRAQGGIRAEPDGYGLIVTVHAALFGALALEWHLAPWTRWGWHTGPFLAIACATTAVRYWCARTLGVRWCHRVLRLPGRELVHAGPYRFLRHPNYLAVAFEVPALAFMTASMLTAVVLGAANLVALRRRIRLEDRFLADSTGRV